MGHPARGGSAGNLLTIHQSHYRARESADSRARPFACPAGFSPGIVRGELRERLGFDGFTVTQARVDARRVTRARRRLPRPRGCGRQGVEDHRAGQYRVVMVTPLKAVLP